MTKQILKNLARIAMVLIMATGLIACTDTNEHFVKKGTFEKHDVYVWEDNSGRHIDISGKNSSVDSGYLYAIDKDKDGEFDKIELTRLPKGHSLEQYANLDSLEKIYKKICEQGEI